MTSAKEFTLSLSYTLSLYHILSLSLSLSLSHWSAWPHALHMIIPDQHFCKAPSFSHYVLCRSKKTAFLSLSLSLTHIIFFLSLIQTLFHIGRHPQYLFLYLSSVVPI